MTAARLMTAEHLRQDADAAGINVRRLQGEMAIVRMNEARAEFANLGLSADSSFRQDLYRQPSPPKADPRRAA